MRKQKLPGCWPLVRVVAAMALAGGVLAGCSGGPVIDETAAASPPGTEGTPLPSSSPPAVSVPSVGATGKAPVNQPPPMLGAGVATQTPVWDSAAEQAALSRAKEVMDAFTSTTLTSHQWQIRIDPLLTGRAQQAWSRADLKYFTATAVTGPARLDPDRSNPYWVWATVPTNDGDYRVNLTRLKPGDPWLADMIRPLQIKK